MSFSYGKVLIVGATSGIGEALAARLIKEGKKVIVSGRRQENLDKFVSEHGSDKAAAVPFDISDLSSIPPYVSKVTKEHPDLDCVILNAGIQRGHNFAKPSSIDLDQINQEVNINYTAYVHLTTAILPHLQAKSKSQPAAIVFTSSGLALLPLIRASNYSATKAALHHWTMCLREQLTDDPDSNVKVIEILPPAVQTELHDEKHQPDIKNGRQMGMPLDEFIEATW